MRVPQSGLTVVAAGRYEGALRAALLAYKERGRVALRRELGHLLLRAVGALLAVARSDGLLAATRAGSVILVPVPSGAAAIRRRGGDRIAQLAGAALRARGDPGRRGDPVASGPPVEMRSLLTQLRSIPDSAGLGARARRTNLADALGAVSARGQPAAVIVVDDIVTTGATLAEAARALRAAGWPVLGAATVATTPSAATAPAAPAHPTRRDTRLHWHPRTEGDNVGRLDREA